MNNLDDVIKEFEELVNGLDFIGSFTLYGRKSLKYHIKRLQEENQQLKQQLEQKEDIINKIRELIDELYLTNDDKCYDIYKNILNILDNKGDE